MIHVRYTPAKSIAKTDVNSSINKNFNKQLAKSMLKDLRQQHSIKIPSKRK